MSTISAALVKELRDATGISLMKCKQALEEAAGDMEKARDILRRSGEKDAAKKSDRETGEGVVAIRIQGNKAVLVPVLCETDFVARNPDFIAVADTLADSAIAGTPADDIAIQTAIQKLGENVRAGDIKEITGDVLGSYVHSTGKIGVVVALTGGDADLARDIAMQIAAMNPSVITPEEVDAAAVEKEADIQKELIANEGKPAEMHEKILEGRLRKFREEQSLIKQPFVKDQGKTVEKVLAERGAQVTAFVRVAI